LDLGLRALAQLTDLDWEWSIAGDGPQLNSLKRLARELGISSGSNSNGSQARVVTVVSSLEPVPVPLAA
jgi:hypothetical protein